MRYESGDIATYYFVIYDDGNNKTIIGWSDNKKIIKAYMELHKCKKFKLKEYTAPIDKIGKLLDENINDEIRLINVGILKKVLSTTARLRSSTPKTPPVSTTSSKAASFSVIVISKSGGVVCRVSERVASFIPKYLHISTTFPFC